MNRRADKVKRDYILHANKLDRELNNVHNRNGPVRQRLAELGDAIGLAFGWQFGEVSRSADDLVKALAKKAAGAHWQAMGLADPLVAYPAFLSSMRRRLSVAMARSSAQMLVGRCDRLASRRNEAQNARAQGPRHGPASAAEVDEGLRQGGAPRGAG